MQRIGGIKLKSSDFVVPKDRGQEAMYEMSSCVFRLYQATHEYQGITRDYARNGITMGQAEAHLLTDIADNPGITTTQLAECWRKTTAAISQMITKLEKKGMVERRRTKNNALNVWIYPTPLGEKTSEAHLHFDVDSIQVTLESMRKTCTEAEISAFFKVLEVYIDIIYEKLGYSR